MFATIPNRLVAQTCTWTIQPHCALQGTLTQDKNELLYSQFGINYSDLPPQFRKVAADSVLPCTPRLDSHAMAAHQCWTTCVASTAAACVQGSVLIRRQKQVVVKTAPDGTQVLRARSECAVLHEDVIGDAFWAQHPDLLKD